MSPEKECLRLLECVDESQLLPWITRLLECLDESQLLPWITRRWIALWPDPPETVTRLMSLNYCIQHQNVSSSQHITSHRIARLSRAMHTHTHRMAMPCLAHAHDLASARRPSARMWLANLLLLATQGVYIGPPFKSVEILLKYLYGIKHLIP